MSIALNSLPGEGRELTSLEMGRVSLFQGGPPASGIPTPGSWLEMPDGDPSSGTGRKLHFVQQTVQVICLRIKAGEALVPRPPWSGPV